MGVKIKLDKERELCMTIRTLVEFEKKFEIDIHTGFDNLSMEQYEYLFYLMLKVKDPKIKLEEAGNLLTVDKIREVSDVIAQLVSAGGETEKNSPVPNG